MDSPLRVYTVYLERARIFLRLRFNLRIRFLRHCKDETRENGLDTAIEVMLAGNFPIDFRNENSQKTWALHWATTLNKNVSRLMRVLSRLGDTKDFSTRVGRVGGELCRAFLGGIITLSH